MKQFKQLMLAVCAIAALTVTAQQPDPVLNAITQNYQLTKESLKKNKALGNEMVTKFTYTVLGQGKTTETLHFFYETVRGTYLLASDEDKHFNYYPLRFVTRSYNIGKKKYYEEFLYDKNQQLIFALYKGYNNLGKPAEQRFYLEDGSFYKTIGENITPRIEDVFYQAEELRRAFDLLARNPKE